MTTVPDHDERDAAAVGPRLRRRHLLRLAAAVSGAPGMGLARGGDEPDFGPNVLVCDPATPRSHLQAALDALFSWQADDEMGAGRYAVLFKPGRYELDARLGYYTTVAGLGQSPDDVDIHGAVRVSGGSPTASWRCAENLSVTPSGGRVEWTVSHGAPLRRVRVRGALAFRPGSGGYLADSAIDELAGGGSGQQWLARGCELGAASACGAWNPVCSGVLGAPEAAGTTLASSPVTREKPYLYLDATGRYRVFLPALRRDASGTSWAGGRRAEGESLSIQDFFVARPADGARRINEALAGGRHLLLTPGVYHLDQALRVTRENTVVLGLGLPSLAPDRGTAALRVDDVDGVRVAGLLVDAGPYPSAVLVEIGQPHRRSAHRGNPISVQDVFLRVGGPWLGRAMTSLIVNSNDTIVDNVWAWRADRGNGVGARLNTADTGVVVNGADVTAYGLFVQHYQQHQTVWNGPGGRTIFYQSSVPGTDWASYKVSAWVPTHEAWGLGIGAGRAVEVPDVPGVRLHDVRVRPSGAA